MKDVERRKQTVDWAEESLLNYDYVEARYYCINEANDRSQSTFTEDPQLLVIHFRGRSSEYGRMILRCLHPRAELMNVTVPAFALSADRRTATVEFDVTGVEGSDIHDYSLRITLGPSGLRDVELREVGGAPLSGLHDLRSKLAGVFAFP